MSSIHPPPDSSSENLISALEAAHHPSALSEERHEAILARALGLAPATPAPFAEPSEQEQREAQRLACALDGQGEHELAEFALALKNAHSPGDCSDLGLARALLPTKAAANPGGIAEVRAPDSALWVKIALGSTATALALAATVLLFWRASQPEAERAALLAQPEFVSSRSLSPLILAKQNHGTTTERMDRIAMARSRDLRHNRYLSWRIR